VADRLPALEEFGVRSRRVAVLRVVAGVVLVGAGVGGFLAGHRSTAALRQGAAAAAGIVAGCLLVFGPFWLRLVRQLAEERRERVRSDERAGMAAHLHDSVLQTLALIQRRADDPREVTRLARAQERELRAWLIEGRGPGSVDGDGSAGLAAAVTAVERDVEADHKIAVEAVTVGDCSLDDDLAALVAAGREAAVNAAKWSGAESVSLFAEVEPDAVSLFVRDKGAGFDPDSVDADRRGIAESIRGRMSRHGGTAVIRSQPGGGTEVELTMPRHNGRI
jgi:signal transduction histidine kinase